MSQCVYPTVGPTRVAQGLALHKRHRWVADVGNHSARQHLGRAAARSTYADAAAAIAHPLMSLQLSQLVGDLRFTVGDTAVDSASTKATPAPHVRIFVQLPGLQQPCNAYVYA